MSIDPLAQDYVYNSPYAFQENKMGLGRELEGLELGPNMLNSKLNAFAGNIGYKFTSTIETVKKQAISIATRFQNVVKDNKKEILGVANGLQELGSKTTDYGLTVAAAGSFVEGVGALPGLKTAEIGGYMQLAGKALETATEYLAGDNNKANSNVVVEMSGYVVDKVFDKVVPDAHPSGSKIVKDVYDTTKEVLKGNANDKVKDGVAKKID